MIRGRPEQSGGQAYPTQESPHPGFTQSLRGQARIRLESSRAAAAQWTGLLTAASMNLLSLLALTLAAGLAAYLIYALLKPERF